MALRGVLTGLVVAGSGVTLLARLTAGGGLVNQASVSSIAYTVTDVTNGLPVGTGTFAVTGSVFNSLQQNDPRWTQDSATRPAPPPPNGDGYYGYNFAASLPASLFPVTPQTAAALLLPPVRYRCDVLFTPTTGQVFRVPFEWTPVGVYG